MLALEHETGTILIHKNYLVFLSEIFDAIFELTTDWEPLLRKGTIMDMFGMLQRSVTTDTSDNEIRIVAGKVNELMATLLEQQE